MTVQLSMNEQARWVFQCENENEIMIITITYDLSFFRFKHFKKTFKKLWIQFD